VEVKISQTSMRVLTYIKYCTSVPNLCGNVNSSYSFASTPLHCMNMWITPHRRTPVPYSGQNKLPHINNIIKSGWRGLGGVGMGWPSTPCSRECFTPAFQWVSLPRSETQQSPAFKKSCPNSRLENMASKDSLSKSFPVQ
jgi:hypothetical protein